jgi:hypothetical protein
MIWIERTAANLSTGRAITNESNHGDPAMRSAVELLFGRTALARSLGRGAVEQGGGETGHPISGLSDALRRAASRI